MLNLYRRALAIRKSHPALGDGTLTWLETPPGVLGFTRNPGFTCLVNQSSEAYTLPKHSTILLASEPLSGGILPPDTAAWLVNIGEQAPLSAPN
jgi:alpha-glucosidase